MEGMGRSICAALSILALACSGGELSTVTGRPGADAGRAGAPARGGPNPDGSCERFVIGTTPGQIPEVLIILDKSGSMEGRPWREAVGAVRELVGTLEERVAFGLATFPNVELDRFGRFPIPIPGPGSLESACDAGEVDVAPVLNAAQPIGEALRDDAPFGNTPTTSTLRGVGTLVGGPDTASQLVVLVTDGAPNCGASPPATGCRCTNFEASCPPEACLDPDAVTAVAEIAARGTPVYVVGFRTSEFRDVLDQMAAAGGTGRTTHIPANDATELTEALSRISGSVLPCSHELEAPPVDISFVRVTIDGVQVDHESVAGPDGWRLDGDRTIELRGASCESLRDTTRARELEITVECEQVTLI